MALVGSRYEHVLRFLLSATRPPAVQARTKTHMSLALVVRGPCRAQRADSKLQRASSASRGRPSAEHERCSRRAKLESRRVQVTVTVSSPEATNPSRDSAELFLH